jgi:hypothetical protein
MENHREFVPHNKIADVIKRIEKLKAANENTCSFLPSWVNGKYFMQFNILETTTLSEMVVPTTIKNDDKEMGTLQGTDESPTVVPECSNKKLDTKPEDGLVYTIDIVEKAVEIAHMEPTVQKPDTVVESAVVEAKNIPVDLKHDKEQEWQKTHTALMNTVTAQLQQKTMEIRSRLDKTRSKPRRFLPKKLFPSNIKMFTPTPKARDEESSKDKPKYKGKPLKPNTVQDRPTSSTGFSPDEEPCVVKKHKTTWKKWKNRIQRFMCMR